MEDARRFAGPAIAVLIVLVAAVLVARIELRQRGEGAQRKSLITHLASESGDAELVALEKKYQSAIDSGAGDAVIGELIDQAIANLRTQVKRGRNATPQLQERLARLESERNLVHARGATAQSQLLEREAGQARESGQNELAADKLREALRLQHEANAAGATPELLTRESRLASEIAEIEAAPLRARIDVARALATAALARDSWDEAIKANEEARAAQSELNARFPAARTAAPAARVDFEAEIESIHARALAHTVAANEQAADFAASAGKSEVAVSGLSAALKAQRELNEKFPRSKLASAERLAQLETKKESVLALDAWRKAAVLDREAAALLQHRQVASATAKLLEAAGMLDQAATAYPHSRNLDAELAPRVRFLAAHRNDLEPWQDKVYPQLMPLPGVTALRWSKTEVPQELYGAIMETNPSRSSGPSLPVESVDWDEARQFCTRMSWVLGARVRLPTEAEFRAAIAALRSSGPAWSSGNAGGKTHDIAKLSEDDAKLGDLLGNVAEWLEPTRPSGDKAPIAGGSYLDSAEGLAAVPVQLVDKRERARHIGFRFVVEL